MNTNPEPNLLQNLPVFESGWVWLVGAGPGDPGLLTLHAANALNQADVIIYDALVGKDVLAYANPNAVQEYAGKRGGKPSPQQRDISLRMIELARQGKRVCRLKGGDPFVFGRGGEEALSLVEAGIPFRIIPGISAGIGGLAYAGIPVTHRETNQAVTQYVRRRNCQYLPIEGSGQIFHVILNGNQRKNQKCYCKGRQIDVVKQLLGKP